MFAEKWNEIHGDLSARWRACNVCSGVFIAFFPKREMENEIIRERAKSAREGSNQK